MISKKPNKCQKCREGEFTEFETGYKCRNCGKNHGKSVAKIYTGWLDDNEEELNKNKASVVSSIRPNFKFVKTVNKGSKRSFTTEIKKDNKRKTIQERYF